ncbi:SGNH/GDSL hydrolase family protein [Streptosporangium sp. G11]|uniref:SGNH/GDSL hydrolase family protein n=1 Tax=Streptosporangium sp. G11 TaxID=3436926 RepID=UPI003EBCEA0F
MSRTSRLRPARRATVTATAVLGACAALVTAGQGTATAAASSAPAVRYVALGDSYASGYGTLPVDSEACGRGKVNYPAVLQAVAKPASYKNVACAGATTRSIWNAQKGQPAQIKALKADTNLITVSIGGNDIGFSKIVMNCALLGLQKATGDPCRQSYNKSGKDEILAAIDSVKSRIGDVVIDAKRHSPHASIALVGYPSLLPDSGKSCRSAQVPFAEGDFAYLRNITVRLNKAIAEQAKRTGAIYVDTYKPSIGHDMCASKDRRWIEPLRAEGSDEILPAAAHPNARGIISLGGTISRTLSQHVGG